MNFPQQTEVTGLHDPFPNLCPGVPPDSGHRTQDTQLLLSALLGPWSVGVGFSLALLSPRPAVIATNCTDAGWQRLPLSLDMTLEARLQSPMPSGTPQSMERGRLPVLRQGCLSPLENLLPSV